ncbi:MAG: peptide protein [Sphingobacteriaceae bacterium]|jgi:uncharacterized protein (DUF2147 family)|nr:peptide protein [Sphingobacteriaceae bacterium]
MKKLYFLLIATLFVLAAHAQNKDAIVGAWQSATGEARIQIVNRAGKYFGEIVWLKEPNENGTPKTDINNPNASLRNHPVLGLELLRNFTYRGDNVWEDGTIYDPKSGKTYSCKITYTEKGKLDIRGYIGISLIGRSEVWTRVK